MPVPRDKSMPPLQARQVAAATRKLTPCRLTFLIWQRKPQLLRSLPICSPSNSPDRCATLCARAANGGSYQGNLLPRSTLQLFLGMVGYGVLDRIHHTLLVACREAEAARLRPRLPLSIPNGQTHARLGAGACASRARRTLTYAAKVGNSPHFAWASRQASGLRH